MNDMSDYMIEAELIKNECDEFERNENKLHCELDSGRFFQLLETEYGYDYKTVSRFIQGGVYTFNEQHEFNIALRKLKRNHDIHISDSILFLEDTMILNHILKFIDEETEWILTDELTDKCNMDKIANIFADLC